MLAFSCGTAPSARALVELGGGARLEFATVDDGIRGLTTRDRFVAALSPFDRAARRKTDGSVTEEEFLAFVAEQVLPWEDAEIDKLASVARGVVEKVRPLQLSLPARIRLVKTSGDEEGHAAYCRGNHIVLPQNVVERPAAKLERLLLHELFHIFSRNQPRIRRELYGIVGFEPCPEIELPESIRPRKLTNPDAPGCDVRIRLEVEGETVDAVPILYSSEDRYDVGRGGEFFDYLIFRLLVVERNGDVWSAQLVDGAPRLLGTENLPSFWERVGRNTNYVIHPEEILADNFVLLATGAEDLATPRVVREMRSVLERFAAEKNVECRTRNVEVKRSEALAFLRRCASSSRSPVER